MTPTEFFTRARLYACPMCGEHVGFIKTWCEADRTATLPLTAEAALDVCARDQVAPQSVYDWYMENLGSDFGEEPEPLLREFGGRSICRKD